MTKPEGPEQEPHTHTPLYEVGNTYCAACHVWLHAGEPSGQPMSVPATPAPSQPAGAREWLFEHALSAWKYNAQRSDGLTTTVSNVVSWMEAYAAQQTAAKDTEIAKWKDEAALRNAGEEAAERERDSLREALRSAQGYLSRLFTALAPQCTQDGDILTLCTQIDNYIAGLRAELAALKQEIKDVRDDAKAAEVERSRNADRFSREGY